MRHLRADRSRAASPERPKTHPAESRAGKTTSATGKENA